MRSRTTRSAAPRSTRRSAARSSSPSAARAAEASLFAEHDLRRLDEDGDVVAVGELQVLGALAGDRGDECLAADVDRDLGHDPAELDVRDLAGELVAGTELHSSPPLVVGRLATIRVPVALKLA